MSRDRRIELIRLIESKRNSKLVVYFLGDRRSFETKIHQEVLPYFFSILKTSHKSFKTIDLYLYASGGITTAGYGIASLLNEFAESYNVLIPFKAYSTATLIALGAKEILMTELGQLSPVDPSVNSPYNPPAPGVQSQGQGPVTLLPVPVEDCIGFLRLAKEQAGIKNDEDITKVFQTLSEKVHPMALGGVYRAREQIRMMSKKLLERNIHDKAKVDEIVETLTTGLYSHDYIISRKEAKEVVGLPVIQDPEIERLMMELFEEYNSEMELTKPYIPEIELAGLGSDKTKSYYRAFIESAEKCYCFITERKFHEFKVTRPGIGVPERAIKQTVIFEGWRELD